MAVVNSEEAEYYIPPRQVLTHVALCGLEQRQTARFVIGSPEEYVHGHTCTLPIMLTQVVSLFCLCFFGVRPQMHCAYQRLKRGVPDATNFVNYVFGTSITRAVQDHHHVHVHVRARCANFFTRIKSDPRPGPHGAQKLQEDRSDQVHMRGWHI